MNTTLAASAIPAGKSPFMLIFKDASTEAYRGLSPEQRQLLFKQWYAWYDRLAVQGKLIHGHPLEEGGRVVAVGAPSDVATVKKSRTAKYLAAFG